MRYFDRVLCVFAAMAGLTMANGLAQEPPTKSLRFLLEYPPWTILKRPSTGWALGDVVTTNSIAEGDPQIIGNIAIDCLPKEAWEIRDRTGPKQEFVGTYQYGMDWVAAWKKYKFDFSGYANLLHGSKKTLVLRAYQESVVVPAATSRWLNKKSTSGLKNIDLLSSQCVQWLAVPDAFKIIGGVFLVRDGDFTVAPNDEVKLGVSGTQPIAGASLSGNITVSEAEHNTVIVKSTVPIAIALREIDLLGKGNHQSNATGSGDESRNSLDSLMRGADLAVDEGR
jgi:hypothetical protein